MAAKVRSNRAAVDAVRAAVEEERNNVHHHQHHHHYHHHHQHYHHQVGFFSFFCPPHPCLRRCPSSPCLPARCHQWRPPSRSGRCRGRRTRGTRTRRGWKEEFLLSLSTAYYLTCSLFYPPPDNDALCRAVKSVHGPHPLRPVDAVRPRRSRNGEEGNLPRRQHGILQVI